MAIQLQQTTEGNSGSVYVSSQATTPFGSNTTTGNALIAFINRSVSSGLTVSSVSDTTNSFSHWFTVNNGSITNLEVWYAANITGLTTPTVTAYFGGGGGTTHAIVYAREYSGLATSSITDVYTSANGNSTTGVSSGASASTNNPNELVVGILCDDNGINHETSSAGSGYGHYVETAPNTALYLALEDKVVSSTGTQTATFGTITSPSSWVCAVATFQAPVSLPIGGYPK